MDTSRAHIELDDITMWCLACDKQLSAATVSESPVLCRECAVQLSEPPQAKPSAKLVIENRISFGVIPVEDQRTTRRFDLDERSLPDAF